MKRNVILGVAGALALSALAGCGSIGQGSTITSLEILPATRSKPEGPYTIYQCLRDQLIVVATFTNGTRADFSYRATWTSSDPSVVQVSNNDLPRLFIVDGQLSEVAASPHRPGTVVPQGSSGTATITASFVGLTASLDVTVAPSALSIATVAPGVDPFAPPATTYVGQDTTQRFTFLANRGGNLATLSMINAAGSLNTVLWRFANGVFVPGDSAITNDFDKYVVPDATNPTAVINVLTGTVTGKAAEGQQYQIEAVADLCPTTPATTMVQIAPFATNGPAITLAHEQNFSGDGQAPSGDLISGTSELLNVTGYLDTDGDGNADQTQDLSTQVDAKLTHTDACVEGSSLCVCTGEDPNRVCTKQVLAIAGLSLFTISNTEGAGGTVEACFSTADDQSHSDDCEETDPGTTYTSSPLTFNAVPVDPLVATFSVVPPSPAMEPALTYPGAQFEVYGSGFMPLEGYAFNGGGMQKFTRLVGWTMRPAGETTQVSTVGFIRSASDGFFNDTGRVAYVDDVTENTALDISITPPLIFQNVTPLPDPVPFTVCPSAGC